MAEATIPEAMRAALRHHQAGELAEAEQIYRQILDRLPKHAGALHLLGVLAGQTGRTDLSVEMIRQAIAIDPSSDIFRINYGNALDAAGRRDEAIASYRTAIQINRSSAQAYFNLGVALAKAGQTADAIEAFQKAIALQPGFAEAHNSLGMLLKDGASPDQAIAAFERAVRYKSDFADAYNNLGNMLTAKKEFKQAIVAYQRVIKINPQFTEAYNNLGAAYLEIGDYELAIDAMRKAIAMTNDRPELFNNLGMAYHAANQVELAVEAWRKVIALDPNSADTYSDLGMGLYELDRLDEAEAALDISMRLKPESAEAFGNRGALLLARGQFNDAIEQFNIGIGLEPDNARLHMHLGIMLLLLGDFEHGWSEYEWRWKVKTSYLEIRQWRSEPLEGKTILLHPEQGLGDTIHFARYAPLLAARGARVILSCQANLMRLFSRLDGIKEIVSVDQPKPAFDEQCTLLSLPLAFGTRIETIPGPQKYIDADPQLAETWKNKLCDRKRFRVGLAWAGSPGYRNDRRRSIRLEQFAPLAAFNEIDFFSLQKGAAATQPSPIAGLIYPEGLDDFADTAALIANLDLVISVDTAVAHLAGAMGKPVWLLIPFIPDWRWLLNRDDTPWYPSMRLFRQKTPGDWAGVIQTVVEKLTAENAARQQQSH